MPPVTSCSFVLVVFLHALCTVHAVALQYDDAKRVAKFAKKRMVARVEVQKQVPLFSHLPQYERETSLSLKVGFSNEEIHPAILRLGLQFSANTISGANSRCVALLNAFKQVIQDYQTPPHKVQHSSSLTCASYANTAALVACRCDVTSCI